MIEFIFHGLHNINTVYFKTHKTNIKRIHTNTNTSKNHTTLRESLREFLVSTNQLQAINFRARISQKQAQPLILTYPQKVL
jgi:hypothetical protein